MTPGEKYEINRRVALAMGWSHLTIDRPQGWYGHKPGEKKLSPLPDFSTDPAAADLVRQEIERRGWSYSIYCDLPDTHKWSVYLKNKDAERHYSVGYAHSNVSFHHALCLAFLAAHEAQGEQP